MPTKQYQIQLQGAATIGIIVLYSIPIRKVLHLGLPLRVFGSFPMKTADIFNKSTRNLLKFGLLTAL